MPLGLMRASWGEVLPGEAPRQTSCYSPECNIQNYIALMPLGILICLFPDLCATPVAPNPNPKY